ncbi:MAG: hypothetical protein EA402_05630 [Planctomycetota bacterium]|nr:MAG: hypothetical protein EA402_05630 [Planctomycetota bacterium]
MAQITIKPKQALFYYNGRHEEEVVLLPSWIRRNRQKVSLCALSFAEMKQLGQQWYEREIPE